MASQRRIHRKPIVYRRAVARGSITLAPGTRRAIRAGKVKKGDPMVTAEVAGLAGMKRTSDLIPHCHVVALTGGRVIVALGPRGVRAEAEAETVGRTGVEMEALVGVAIALLTVWDMVKYLEKDPNGLYPNARIGEIRVVSKEKRALRGSG